MILLYFIITLLLVGSWLCFYPEMKYIYDKLIHSLTPSPSPSLTYFQTYGTRTVLSFGTSYSIS